MKETPTPQPTTMAYLNAWLAFVESNPVKVDDFESWAAGFEACRSMIFARDAKPPESDVEHIDHVLISGTHFTAKLWRLMQTCDQQNLARLSLAFPNHAAALQRWKLGPNTDHDWNLEGAG